MAAFRRLASSARSGGAASFGTNHAAARLLGMLTLTLLAPLALAQQPACAGEALLQNPQAAKAAVGPDYAYGEERVPRRQDTSRPHTQLHTPVSGLPTPATRSLPFQA